MHDEAEFAVRALTAGADGFLTKDSPLDELVKAVNTVITGRKYLSASVAQQLARNVESRTARPPHEELSHREYQFMLLIASGKSLKQIGRELSISAKTVTSY